MTTTATATEPCDCTCHCGDDPHLLNGRAHPRPAKVARDRAIVRNAAGWALLHQSGYSDLLEAMQALVALRV